VPNAKHTRTGYERFKEEINADLDAIKDKHQRMETDEWPEPESLDPLPAVQRFDEALLPDALRPFVVDAAERMQIPVDLPAVVAVAALAGVVNHRVVIQPKQWDTTWTVTPNLWASLIVPSGFLKSPTIEVVTRPLRRIEKGWKEQYDQDLQAHTLAAEEYALCIRAWGNQFVEAKKKNRKPPPRPDAIDAEPTRRRLITNDATYEKLHQLMSQNPAGLLLIRDELTGWLSRLDREEHSAERAFALQAWNGDTPLVLDRMGRGTLDVPYCCLSVIGGITPSRLRAYLTAPQRPGLSGDGLIQRFQLAVWPDFPEGWKYIDRPPHQKAEQQVSEVYGRLVQMKSDEPLRLRFSREAQALFIEWLAELETRVRGKSLPSDLNSHFAKYRSLMPSLGGLFERVDGGGESISPSHARQAAGWTEYLQSHAERIYSGQVRPEYEAAVLLSQKIRDHKADVDGVLEVRRVYRHHWEGLSSPETVKAAAEILVDFGWLREIGEPTGGRPANKYTVNPRVWK
jgi:hypothetical protein